MILLDAEFFRRINDVAGRWPALDAFGIFAAKYLIYVMAAALLAAALGACVRHRDSVSIAGLWSRLRRIFRRQPADPESLVTAVIRALLAGSAAALGNFIFSLVLFRPRPCLALRQVHQLIVRTCADKSFPSDHASVAFALAFSVVFLQPVFGCVLLAAAVLVAWGRVFVGVHYPLDVAAGAAVGLIWALIARAADERYNLTRSLVTLWSKAISRLKLC